MVYYDPFTACVAILLALLCFHLLKTSDMVLKVSVWIGVIYGVYVKP